MEKSEEYRQLKLSLMNIGFTSSDKAEDECFCHEMLKKGAINVWLSFNKENRKVHQEVIIETSGVELSLEQIKIIDKLLNHPQCTDSISQ